jgi:histidinol-phosphate/aromatic aminotransferase/cobyric acid decarboxylase-like protein
VTVAPAGAHGGDARLVAASLGLEATQVLDLSLSLNPFAPDPTPIVRRHLDAGVLGRYPDRVDIERAGAAMAGALGIDPSRLLLTNGGAEAIALVATELGAGWVQEPEFSLYARHLAVSDPTGPRFRSDPHNPSGRLAADGESAEVWDEAFYPLCTGRWSAPGRVGSSVVLGSLTKVLSCPGLRLGYLVAPDDDGAALGVPGLHQRLATRQPAWSVGPLALAALPDLLATADVVGWATAVARARRELVEVLVAHGFAPFASDANFVLVPGAAGLRNALATHAVVVRDCTSFGLPDHVRIAVPDGLGLARLDAALAACTAQIHGNGAT